MREANLVRGVKELLTLLKKGKELTFRRVHTVGVPRGTFLGKVRFGKNTDMAGMADFLVFIKDGPVLSIECKGTTTRQTPAQKDWQEELISLGHHYFTVKTLEEVLEILNRFGVKKLVLC